MNRPFYSSLEDSHPESSLNLSGAFSDPLAASATPSNFTSNFLSSNPDLYVGRDMPPPSFAESSGEMHTHMAPNFTPLFFDRHDPSAPSMSSSSHDTTSEDLDSTDVTTQQGLLKMSIDDLANAEWSFVSPHAMQSSLPSPYQIAIEICNDFCSRVDTSHSLYVQKNHSQRADFAETWKSYQQEWHTILSTHRIMDGRCLDEMLQKKRPLIDFCAAESGMAADMVQATKLAKQAIAMWVKTPIPCTPKENKPVGPWRVRFVLPPGVERGANVTFRAKSVTTSHQLSRSPKLPNPPTTSSDGVIYYVDEGDYYEIPVLSFSQTSNGTCFEVEFTFVVEISGRNHNVTLRSPPFTTASNINQWSKGEGCYVSYLAFKEASGPSRDTPFIYFFNMLQFAHLTATRQLVSPYYFNQLEAAALKVQVQRKKSRVDPNSKKSQDAQKEVDLYESFRDYTRVKRLLTEEEVKKVFPPRVIPNLGEVIFYSDFCDAWDWYGEVMYKFFTGQVPGHEPRLLWLEGLIHIVAPGERQNCGMLDVTKHPPGTGLIRTSEAEKMLTFSAVIESENGESTIVSSRPNPSNNIYSTELSSNGGIKYLLNTSGRRVLKREVIERLVSTPKFVKEGYVDNI
jgi:hypothetical protein